GHVDEDVDEVLDIAHPDREHHVLELRSAIAGEPADVSEVQERDVRSVGKSEVPWVWIGVEERIAKDHLEEDVRGPMDEDVDIPPRRLDAGAIRERTARDQAHCEHATARELGIRSRD